MMQHHLKTFCKVLIGTSALAGCTHNSTLEKLSYLGEPPELSQIQNPTLVSNYRPISMPMPAPQTKIQNINSLWEVGSRAFFKDQRASKVGDILTVIVNLNQNQRIEMKPNISRNSDNKKTLTSFLGLAERLKRFIPTIPQPDMIDTSSSINLNGTAAYDITDKINFKLAAIITQTLPNGSVVVHGRTEVRLLNELREIHVTGVVRREDISSSNTITSDKIAEMRISYGGRGDLSELQDFPIATQITNKIFPYG